ncbi:MAG: C2H2-type zinc finger protein [Nitrososphaerota archaeon]|nr:C2H2-type zinc finger protein [Nitrososphaerota archaeon]
MKPDSSGVQSKEVVPSDSAVYFCPICFQAFNSSELLEQHMKTHRELEISASSCRMLATPAGVD